MSVKSQITLNSVRIPISVHSDGAINVSVPPAALISYSPVYQIEFMPKCPAGPMALFILLDYLQTQAYSFNAKINLNILYMPFARQDRVTGSTPFSLRTFCTLLQSYKNISSINILDPHSNVPETLLTVPTTVVAPIELLKDVDAIYNFLDNVDLVIAPDQGAYKKSKVIAEKFELPLMVADKQRDTQTNQIKLSFIQSLDLEGKTVLVPDDIVDYGTSVRELAQLLKTQYKVGKVIVYATHGILPYNLRQTPHSRYSFILEQVDELYLHSLWTDASTEDLPENVFYLQNV